MVDNETCVAFEFCVVETGEFVETGGVVEDAEEEVLGNVDELVVVFDVEESGVVIVVDFIDDVVVVVDFAGDVVEIADIGLLEAADDPIDVFEVLEGEEWWEETVVMRLGSTMLLHRSP